MKVKFRIHFGDWRVKGTVYGANGIELRNKVAKLIDSHHRATPQIRRALLRKFDEQLEQHGIEVRK